jgi:hypothetical protein
MELAGSVLIVLNSVAAAVLLQAGLYKMAVPAPLRRALAELAPRYFGALRDRHVRVVAAVEISVGLALLAPAVRVPGAIAAAVLGVAFAVLGVAGRLRRSEAPCGCLGAGAPRSLGLLNVVVGLVLAAFGVFSATATVVGGSFRLGPVLTALFLLLLCVWMNRGVALQLLRRKAALVRMGDS